MKNKQETKRKLVKAVGEILKAEGYAKLGVNNIARQAGVNKKLIYRYFGTVEYLIEAYVVVNDYWMTFSENLKSLFAETGVCVDEQAGILPEDIVLDAPIPFITIKSRPKNKLKTKYRKRIIPLTGYALEAFEKYPQGFRSI